MESFVVHNQTRTIFDILESIFVFLKEEGEIAADFDPNAKLKDDDNSLAAWYKRLAEMIYVNSRQASGSKAIHVLEKFTFSRDPEPFSLYTGKIEESKGAQKYKAKAQEQLKSQMDFQIEIQKRNRKIKDYQSLYMLAYTNNNFITFPYIHEIGKSFVPNVDDFIGRFSMFNKHKLIFDLLVKRMVDTIPVPEVEKAGEPKAEDEKTIESATVETSPLTEVLLKI